jgi:hypothetical protein
VERSEAVPAHRRGKDLARPQSLVGSDNAAERIGPLELGEDLDRLAAGQRGGE